MSVENHKPEPPEGYRLLEVGGVIFNNFWKLVLGFFIAGILFGMLSGAARASDAASRYQALASIRSAQIGSFSPRLQPPPPPRLEREPRNRERRSWTCLPDASRPLDRRITCKEF